jgi:hypothetical protein
MSVVLRGGAVAGLVLVSAWVLVVAYYIPALLAMAWGMQGAAILVLAGSLAIAVVGLFLLWRWAFRALWPREPGGRSG